MGAVNANGAQIRRGDLATKENRYKSFGNWQKKCSTRIIMNKLKGREWLSGLDFKAPCSKKNAEIN